MKIPTAPKGINALTGSDLSIKDEFRLRKLDYEFIESLGLTVLDARLPSGWLHITSTVLPHVDGYGYCLVYCSAGAGSILTNRQRTTLVSGTFTIFDDRDKHSFKPHSSYVNIMVVNVKQSCFIKKLNKNYPTVGYV